MFDSGNHGQRASPARPRPQAAPLSKSLQPCTTPIGRITGEALLRGDLISALQCLLHGRYRLLFPPRAKWQLRVRDSCAQHAALLPIGCVAAGAPVQRWPWKPQRCCPGNAGNAHPTPRPMDECLSETQFISKLKCSLHANREIAVIQVIEPRNSREG